MTIKEFIRDFKDKKIFADVSLPKYVDLTAKVIEEGKKEEITTTPDNLTWIQNSNVSSARRLVNPTFPTSVSSHLVQILDKDYESVMKFLKEDPDLKVFNDSISEYLRAESGTSLSFMGTRPGGIRFSEGSTTGRNWLYKVIEDPDSISEEQWNKSINLSWIDKIKLLLSKKESKRILKNLAGEAQTMMVGTNSEEIKKIQAERVLSIDDFFDQVKVKATGKDEALSRIKPIFKSIAQAKAMGQTALIETLLEKLVVEVYECAIVGSGFDRAISLTDLEDLQEKCKKLLSINQISNFIRPIPADVIEKKLQADKLHVFDNYVVLSYDPSGKDYKETINQKEKKRDPILFGVILGSEKLYYIGDWIDEYCDLTWDKMLSIMGKSGDDFKL